MKTKGQVARQDKLTIKNIIGVPSHFIRGIQYHAAGHIYTPKPVYTSLRVTRRCNARCIMCSDWKTKDNDNKLTLDEIGKIYSNSLFKSLKRIGLSGGEPTLREDLAQITQIILDCCPQIREIALVTNGLEPSLVTERVQQLLTLFVRRKLNGFSVAVSIDGYGDTDERIRRVPDAFNRASETIGRLKQLQHETPFHLCSTCVVQPSNIDNLVQLLEFANKVELPLTLVPIRISDSLIQNESQEHLLRLTDSNLKKLKVLFERQLQPYLVPSNIAFWREYFNIINGEKRRLPCYLLHHFAEVDSDGTLRICVQRTMLNCGNVLDDPPDRIWYSKRVKEMRLMARKIHCSKCADCCDMDNSFRQEFFYYTGYWLKEKSKKLLRQ